MSRVRLLAAFAFVVLGFALALDHGPIERTERFGRFGIVHLYRASSRPSRVVLFASGDGGWNRGVVDMARQLSSLDALVVGIDTVHLLRELERSSERCVYPAADFEALSQFLQHELELPHYEAPVLVGYSSGAALVYAVLAQAPANSFRGGLSLGFCPVLSLDTPLCRGSGLAWEKNAEGKGVSLLPAKALETPWIALQGSLDEVCDAQRTREYAEQVKGAEVVLLPGVGHGFSVPRDWAPQLRDAVLRLAGPDSAAPALAAAVPDLPLVEVEAHDAPREPLAVLVSGDGGWASIDRGVSAALAARGVPVVGLDSLQYFWTPRSADESATALERILDHYLERWQRDRVILIGYSRGADVLPFMVSRLPARLRSRVALVALLGPSSLADFEFHLSDWIANLHRSSALPVGPEVEKLRGERILCIYGRDEKDSLCPELPGGLAALDPRPGGHHFGGNYPSIAARILEEARGAPR